MDAANRELMLRDGAVVWLDAPFETVLQRMPARRPPPAGRRSAGMEQLYNQRLAAYSQAHLRVDAVAAPSTSWSITSWSGWS